MQTPEFRVRPVVRYALTRYTPAAPLPPGVHTDSHPGARLETLGEVDSEGYAEIIAEALRERAAPREYVLVQETMGEVMAKVYYAYGEADALARLAELRQGGESYRIYHRIKPPIG